MTEYIFYSNMKIYSIIINTFLQFFVNGLVLQMAYLVWKYQVNYDNKNRQKMPDIAG